MIVSDQVDTEHLKRIRTNLNRDSQAMKNKEIVENQECYTLVFYCTSAKAAWNNPDPLPAVTTVMMSALQHVSPIQ